MPRSNMLRSAARILALTGFGLVCSLAGVYYGVNHAYDSIAGTLPSLLHAAGCTAGLPPNAL